MSPKRLDESVSLQRRGKCVLGWKKRTLAMALRNESIQRISGEDHVATTSGTSERRGRSMRQFCLQQREMSGRHSVEDVSEGFQAYE